MRQDRHVRWDAKYRGEDDREAQPASVEAASRSDAVRRLREVIGPQREITSVVLAACQTSQTTFETFLHDPDAAAA
jgi:hypothetical protein